MHLIKILYVDDEINNLNSFKASFRRLYEVHTATSGAGGLAFLSQTEIHIVISDQRMPGMTGVELFRIVKDQYPGLIRILLTGYTDIEALADAINTGDIYRYVTKPWNEIELNNSIQNGYDMYNTKRALKEKLTELQRTNDKLNRFVYSISHELRAPLASAIGVIDLAKLDQPHCTSHKCYEYWSLIEDCCHRLDYNIANMLQYYKNSRYSSSKETIDFNKTIQSLVSLHKLANQVKNHIQFEVNITQPLPFAGDVFRIEVIVGNLISNAIKYQNPSQPNKTVRVDVNVTAAEAAITIEDNGLGMEPDYLNKIFNQFFRIDNQKGTGLGLFIVKEALDKLGGRITVTSTLNSGTCFSLTIPNQQATAATEE